MRSTIIVFAKAPEPGKVKTRLTTLLSAKQAATLHERLVLHTLTTLRDVAKANVELWCAPDSDHPFFRYCQANFPITLHEQQGHDLGNRMWHAMQDVLTRSQHSLIIGTDCPMLEQAHINNSLSALEDGVDCVITPATDGGYVMLGLNKIDPLLFNNIHWGSETVFTETVKRLDALAWRWQQQDALNDIDTPQDLNLLEHIDLPQAVM